ncbi:hypothetical protein ABMA79_14680 [Halobacteriovorax sp. HFRX-2_2]|uniref:hypothetical protein n=1 Tax=unclassified Halobacteriovorax TaxID=2639665 RepID=UPI0037238EC9
MKYRVNLDFDAALAANNPKIKIDKYLTELEYIFFLVNDSSENTLCTKLSYSQEYLDSLGHFGFITGTVTTDLSNYFNWWGDLRDFNNAQLLNSKCWLASWYKPLEDLIINKGDSVEIHGRRFYRPDQSFSGIGNKIIKNHADLERVNLPGVLSKYVKVIKTFGVTYDLKTDDFFVVENLTGPNGQFKGGCLIDLDELGLEFDLNSTINLIKENLPNKSIQKIQFDNMIYEDESGELKLCPLVELNYRRTMGEVIFNVTKTLGKGTLHFGDKQYLNKDSVILSPPFVKNICYYNRVK